MKRKFKIGDTVTHINDAGINWGDKKIIGFTERCGKPTYYIDPSDTPWFDVPERNLHTKSEEA